MTKRRHDAISSKMTADPETKVIEIVDPDGDVVFCLKGGKCVQVSSSVMKLASPVFAAMLGPVFKEGHALAASHSQPVEIILPDDDPKGFIPICRILHLQRGLIEQVPTSKDLLRVRLVADKYDLLDPISLCVEAWVKKHVSNVHGAVHGPVPSMSFQTVSDVIQAQEDSDENGGYCLKSSQLFLLLLVCYEFGDQDGFGVISQRIMREHLGSFITLATIMEPRTRGLVDIETIYKLAGTLQVKRASLFAEVPTLLQIDMFDCIVNLLSLAPQNVAQYFENLVAYDNGEHVMFGGPNTDQYWSLHSVLISIANFQPSHFPCLNTLAKKKLRGHLRESITEFEAGMKGLCILCVQKGETECIGDHEATSS